MSLGITGIICTKLSACLAMLETAGDGRAVAVLSFGRAKAGFVLWRIAVLLWRIALLRGRRSAVAALLRWIVWIVAILRWWRTAAIRRRILAVIIVGP